MVKQFENEREKFLILKETADKKEIDLEKEISELRVQMIEMRDTCVSGLKLDFGKILLNFYKKFFKYVLYSKYFFVF